MRLQIALATALIVTAAATQAQAADRCAVTDPTGTPLNLRAAPNGRILATLNNRQTVQMLDQVYDDRGRAWALVRMHGGGGTGVRGYVFREFVSCY